MSKRDVLIFIFKWKAAIAGYFLFVFALVLTLLYLLPENYVSRASVLIERNRAPTMRSVAVAGLDMVEVMNTEAQMAMSRTVMERVVDRLKLADLPRRDTTFRRIFDSIEGFLVDIAMLPAQSRRDRWIRNLSVNVEAEPITNSNILAIKYEGDDPELGAKIANAVTDVFIELHLSVYSTRGASEFYRKQMEQAEEELLRVRREVVDYKQQVSASAIEVTKPQLVRDLSLMRVGLTEARNLLAEVLVRFQPNHPQVVLARTKVTDFEEQIARVSAEIQSLEVKEERIREIELGARTLERSFSDYKQKFEEARASELANPDTVNVRLVEYSSPPKRPRFTRLFFASIGMLGALAFSILLAVLREYFDHRVNAPEAAEAAFGVPVFGSIEQLSWLSRVGMRRRYAAALRGG